MMSVISLLAQGDITPNFAQTDVIDARYALIVPA